MRQVILRPGEDGLWVVEVPSLPGCVTQGRNRDEAVANAREAIELWVEDAIARGEQVPEERFDVVVCAV